MSVVRVQKHSRIITSYGTDRTFNTLQFMFTVTGISHDNDNSNEKNNDDNDTKNKSNNDNYNNDENNDNIKYNDNNKSYNNNNNDNGKHNQNNNKNNNGKSNKNKTFIDDLVSMIHIIIKKIITIIFWSFCFYFKKINKIS